MDDVLRMAKNNRNTMRVFIICFVLVVVYGKKHKLKVEKDTRKTIDLTTFGFLQGGFLQVNVSGFTTEPVILEQAYGYLGFTLSKLESSGMSYLETKQNTCMLREPAKNLAEDDVAVIVFTMDFKNKLVHVQKRGKDVQNMTLSTDKRETFDLPVNRRKRSLEFLRDSYLLPASRTKRQTSETGMKDLDKENQPKPVDRVRLPPVISPSSSVKNHTPNTAHYSTSPLLNKDEVQIGKPAGTNIPVGQTQDLAGANHQPDQSQGIIPARTNNQVDPSRGSSVISGQLSESKLPVYPTGALQSHISQSETEKSKSQESQIHKGPLVSNPQENLPPKVGTIPPSESSDITKDSFSMHVDDQGRVYFLFVAYINSKDEEGLYELYFHNCLNTEDDAHIAVNFSVYLIEKNGDNYLSAGHIPLPTIYFLLSVVFFVLGCFWLYTLKKSTEGVYKIHYLMLTLVYIKSLALLFHAINFHFMAQQGHHEEAIAIIYYITYLMRGILLFVTIVLIGAGWAFVKYILSDRDKKIFIIVIPLQVLANVAQIIIEETEEGETQFITWNEIFIIVDLLCCGAILFPVVWSIRHLQDASQTDGKAAINLIKLKLFRHFYILIVCYIYFTRIIVYLLRIAVPFQYEWMDEFFRELAVMVFYIVTAYKFRPASNNPYLQVPQDSDDELEMDEVVTQSGALEGLTKVNVKYSGGNGDSTTAASTTNKRESSHEYD